MDCESSDEPLGSRQGWGIDILGEFLDCGHTDESPKRGFFVEVNHVTTPTGHWQGFVTGATWYCELYLKTGMYHLFNPTNSDIFAILDKHDHGGTLSDLVAVLFRVYGRNDCGINQIVLLFFCALADHRGYAVRTDRLSSRRESCNCDVTNEFRNA